MRNDTKNKKIDVLSLEDDKIIKQETLTIQEHQADKIYNILSRNSFGEGAVLAPGYFNKKTDFKIGEVDSLIFSDKFLNYKTGLTSELIKQESFILYPIPCFNIKSNYTLNYDDYLTHDTSVIELSESFGKDIGKFLFLQDDKILEDYNKGFLRLFINTSKGYSLNKNIIINSNPVFAISIIRGYFEASKEKGLYIKSNVNLYTFSTLLNYLGASYSIRNSKNNTKKVYMQFQSIFSKYMLPKFIKPEMYYYDFDSNSLVLKTSSIEESQKNDLISNINNEQVIAIPVSSFDFVETTGRVFDLTCEKSTATNYALPFSPFLKNSDGDILAASGIFTKEGLVDAMEFSPERKTYYKNLNSGKMNQWIADDAIIGLYNATNQK